MKKKLLIVVISVFIGLSILWVVWFFSNQVVNQSRGELDVVIDTIPAEEATQLLMEGKVERVEYPKEYKDSLLVGSARIVLKDGQSFHSAPISAVLSAIDRCGDPCKDLEVEEY